MRRIRLNYSNVVASLALFAALGGSSYAAIAVTGANVRDGSLSGRDVRDASLTGRDVRDQSLLSRDFKRGQLPAGPKGDAGPQGLKGEPGQSGPKGEPGLAFVDASGLTPPVAPDTKKEGRSVSLERASRLLVQSTMKESEFTCSAALATSCKVQFVPTIDGKAQPTSVPTLLVPPGQTRSFPPATDLFVVTDELPPGQHIVGVTFVATPSLYYQYAAYGATQILAVD